jgi:hypothetical protein
MQVGNPKLCNTMPKMYIDTGTYYRYFYSVNVMAVGNYCKEANTILLVNKLVIFL